MKTERQTGLCSRGKNKLAALMGPGPILKVSAGVSQLAQLIQAVYIIRSTQNHIYCRKQFWRAFVQWEKGHLIFSAYRTLLLFRKLSIFLPIFELKGSLFSGKSQRTACEIQPEKPGHQTDLFLKAVVYPKTKSANRFIVNIWSFNILKSHLLFDVNLSTIRLVPTLKLVH